MTAPEPVDYSTLSAEEIEVKLNSVRNEVKRLGTNQAIVDKEIASLVAAIRHGTDDIVVLQDIVNAKNTQLETLRRLKLKILSTYAANKEAIHAVHDGSVSTDVAVVDNMHQMMRHRLSDLQMRLQLVQREEEMRKAQSNNKSRLFVEVKTFVSEIRKELTDDVRKRRGDLITAGARFKDEETKISETIADFEEQTGTVMRRKLSEDMQLYHSRVRNANADIQRLTAEVIKLVTDFNTNWAKNRERKAQDDSNAFLAKVKNAASRRRDVSKRQQEAVQQRMKVYQLEQTNLKAQHSAMEEKKMQLNEAEDANNKELIEQKGALAKAEELWNMRFGEITTKRNMRDALKMTLAKEQLKNLNRVKSPAKEAYNIAWKHYWRLVDKLETYILEKRAAELTGTLKTEKPTLEGDPDNMVLSRSEGLIVQGANLEALAKWMFSEHNSDSLFIPGLVVLSHSDDMRRYADKQTGFDDLINTVCREYRVVSGSVDGKKRMTEFLSLWVDWFPNDLKTRRQLLDPLVEEFGISTAMRREPIDNRVKWSSSVPYESLSTGMTLESCTSALILVEHLSYIECKILSQIVPCEFMETGWMRTDKWHVAPHVVKMTDHFNAVAKYVIKSIMVTTGEADLAAVVMRWIEVMKEAHDVYNYQLVFEVYGALRDQDIDKTVTRVRENLPKDNPHRNMILEKTWGEVSKLTDSSSRFANYRQELGRHSPEFVVPYIGPILTSLVYISEGNQAERAGPNGKLANFTKHRLYAQGMQEVTVDWGAERRFLLSRGLLSQIQAALMQ